MCTNSARLVNSLECYMDDLVDCFEDFVKKSLFIISIAVGALIVMLGYVLKIVTERTQAPMGFQGGLPRHDAMISSGQGSPDSPRTSIGSMPIDDIQKSKSGSLPQKSVNSVTMTCFKNDCKKTSSAGANTGPLSSIPSFDERVLRNIGLSSCSKDRYSQYADMHSKSSSINPSALFKVHRKPEFLLLDVLRRR